MDPSFNPDERGPDRAANRCTANRGVVLLVEDNTMNQLVATRMLAKLGYRCDVAEQRTAKRSVRIAAGDYDAVLMDCQMPEMDGYEATRLLRRSENRARAGTCRSSR